MPFNKVVNMPILLPFVRVISLTYKFIEHTLPGKTGPMVEVSKFWS